MATLTDILGSYTRTKIPARWNSHYQRLCAERDRLIERDCSSGEVFQPKLDDLADAASQEDQRSLLMVTASATQGTIAEVLEAIARIERGTYGICEITGAPIPTERLDSIPWTRYSIEGQRQLEEAGLSRRPGLPALVGLTGTDTTEGESESEEDSE
ncbi:MAG TPA: TraR/DksA family transcriptional regulator [Verrucomicrobiae bacterium]|nr:TraR/DksA family transcriptional regulator [Verrucomicrobiae bacterium]